MWHCCVVIKMCADVSEEPDVYLQGHYSTAAGPLKRPYISSNIRGWTLSCHKICYNFQVVHSWRQWGGRVVRMAVLDYCPFRYSSQARNGSSSRTQLLPTRPRRLRSGCGGTFWPSSASRIGPRAVQTSTPRTINCGLFWRTWCAESITTAWRA